MENCIELRINAGDKNAGNARGKAIADAYRNKFTLKCQIVQHPITKQTSGTDYVMELLSTVTTELPNLQYHHQKF